MELCGKCSCMFLTNMTVFCTEWFYSTAHCLQEKSHQSHGTPGEIWGFNPGYNRGRKMFHVLKKHSFSLYFFASFFPLSYYTSLSLMFYLNEEAPSLCRCRGVKLLLLCFAVGPHTNTRGCIYGPLEHSPPSAAERSLSRCH